MSYRKEREAFIARMTREGLPLGVTRLLLREATGLNRRAELACSSEAADRDRVDCPASSRHVYHVRKEGKLEERSYARKPTGPCLCDALNDGHQDITRITLQDWFSERRIQKALAWVNVQQEHYTGNETQRGLWSFITEGDPRGYVLRVIPPSYAERNEGKDRFNLDAIGVPNGPSRLRF